MAINAVLVDVDNTLLDFNEAARVSAIRGFEAFGIDYPQEIFSTFHKVNQQLWARIEDGSLQKSELYQMRWNTIFAEHGISADGVAFEQLFRQGVAESSVPMDGALALLAYLKNKYKVCIASNASYRQQVGRLERAGMLRYVDAFFISEQIGFPKPQRAFFEACIAGTAAEPARILMIGDSYEADIVGAHACGIKTCWYNPQGFPAGSVAPDLTVARLDEIAQYI
ncbi:MAG: YjjG family noncanonical pyrimidine nucleotidase [Clostridia bacterium]|nr:YjjG family noncanonical pyrimidine nucleotidase [Clostridia bacterium]